MNEYFKVSLYDLLSKDKRISRFKEFRDIEVKTIMLFLMQIGFLKSKMTKNFTRILYLNEMICIKKTYISYIELKKIQKTRQLEFNLKKIRKDIKEYERLKKIVLKYIKRVDSTENNEIVASFKSVIIYQESMQRLYEEIAKNEQKISEMLKEIKR